VRIRICAFFCVFLCAFSFAQNHVSVPVSSNIYYLLENAQMRGLCAPLTGAKPYSRSVILNAIDQILSSEDSKLTDNERLIFEEEKQKYSKPQEGLDLKRGGYYIQSGQSTLDLTASWRSVFSQAIFTGEDEFSWGTDNWLTVDIAGDLGKNFSYDISGSGGFFRAPTQDRGDYNTYYSGYGGRDHYENRPVRSFSPPLPYFPYSYKKNWDSSIFYLDKLSASGYYSWPNELAFGYNILGEISGSLLDGRLTYRGGRIDREWAAMSNGRSLALNAMARPFLALEATASPFDWLNFSAITGVLEYYNSEGIKKSAMTFQNAFSMALVEVNVKNFHFDFGSSAVWPKRFEMGYIFPLNSNFFYQNNIGDFDNLGIYFNLRMKFPPTAVAWASFFADEFDLSTKSDFFKLDRNMYAFQLGATFYLRSLSFSQLTVSFTKIEPYTYTHTREAVPWYGVDQSGKTLAMESAYINNGENLGYYLPPNSAELLVKFESMTGQNTMLRSQFQLIIHGADFGPNAVDGSSLLSELDPDDRDDRSELKKFFLQDGAYEWTNVLKFGAEHTLKKYSLPIQLFGEIGVVHSFFTNIDGAANSGEKESFSFIDTSAYRQSTKIIATMGFRVYPR
jgi:hypothetical protein